MGELLLFSKLYELLSDQSRTIKAPEKATWA